MSPARAVNDALSALVRTASRPASHLPLIGRLIRSGPTPPGAPPGKVVHTGPRRLPEPRIEIIRYGPDGLEEEAGLRTLPDDLPIPAAGEGVLWVNVEGLHDVELLERIGERMDFHPLAMEDVAHVGQRPKLEEYEGHLFILTHMLMIDPESLRVADEQLSLIVGPGYVFSFQEAPGDVLEGVRTRLRSGKGRIRSRGSDYLAYALVDAVVDAYFHLLEPLGERAEELETEVLDEPTRETMRSVHELKRELLLVRRSVWPLREMLSAFLRAESPLVSEGTRVYLRDVYDHAYQLMDAVELLREMTSGIRDLYLSSMSNRTNEVMKVLTIMASIFIPLTFVAGVYGMNFEYMPELGVRWAYPAVLVVMVVVSAGMLVYFRRREWI